MQQQVAEPPGQAWEGRGRQSTHLGETSELGESSDQVYIGVMGEVGAGVPRTGRMQAPKGSVPSLQGHFECWSPTTRPEAGVRGHVSGGCGTLV